MHRPYIIEKHMLSHNLILFHDRNHWLKNKIKRVRLCKWEQQAATYGCVQRTILKSTLYYLKYLFKHKLLYEFHLVPTYSEFLHVNENRIYNHVSICASWSCKMKAIQHIIQQRWSINEAVWGRDWSWIACSDKELEIHMRLFTDYAIISLLLCLLRQLEIWQQMGKSYASIHTHSRTISKYVLMKKHFSAAQTDASVGFDAGPGANMCWLSKSATLELLGWTLQLVQNKNKTVEKSGKTLVKMKVDTKTCRWLATEIHFPFL